MGEKDKIIIFPFYIYIIIFNIFKFVNYSVTLKLKSLIIVLIIFPIF